MKIAVIIVRVLMGALLLFASVSYLFHLVPQPEMPESPAKTYMDGLMAVQLMPIVKVIELICAILLLAGRYVALAAIAIFPISLNIFLFHAMLNPSDLGAAAFLLLGNLFLFYAYRKHYDLVFSPKRIE